MAQTTEQTTAAGAAPGRSATADIHPMFLQRWSPRGYSGRTVPRDVLDRMVEAARWAPSSGNEQPWQFHVTTTGPVRDASNAALAGFNQAWAPQAPVLTWVTARRTWRDSPLGPAGKPNRHAWFDTGAATLQFILEGERHGVRSRMMGGLDGDAGRRILGLPDDVDVICAIASGYPADPADLPEPVRAREKPSQRKPPAEVATFW